MRYTISTSNLKKKKKKKQAFSLFISDLPGSKGAALMRSEMSQSSHRKHQKALGDSLSSQTFLCLEIVIFVQV